LLDLDQPPIRADTRRNPEGLYLSLGTSLYRSPLSVLKSSPASIAVGAILLKRRSGWSNRPCWTCHGFVPLLCRTICDQRSGTKPRQVHFVQGLRGIRAPSSASTAGANCACVSGPTASPPNQATHQHHAPPSGGAVRLMWGSERTGGLKAQTSRKATCSGDISTSHEQRSPISRSTSRKRSLTSSPV
jgi:hypothetical protein